MTLARSGAPRDRLVVIGWAYGLPEGAAARSALEAAGIPVHSSVWHFAANSTHLMVGFGGIDLRVPAPLACEALAILAAGSATPDRRRGLAGRLCLVLLFLVSSVPPPASGLALRPASSLARNG